MDADEMAREIGDLRKRVVELEAKVLLLDVTTHKRSDSYLVPDPTVPFLPPLSGDGGGGTGPYAGLTVIAMGGGGTGGRGPHPAFKREDDDGA